MVRRAIRMLIKLRIGRRLYTSLKGLKGINEEIDCKCCERAGLWLEYQSKKLLRCGVYSVPREIIAILAGYAYKPDVGVCVRRHKIEALLSRSTFSRPTSLSNPSS
jgi:hypothetical protein